MKTKLIKNNSDELIVFLSGWGCDEHSYSDMKSSRDVLICWDYTSLDFEFNFEDYKTICLIAYSAGVFVSGLIKDKLPKFSYKIAVNGNPKLFDNKYNGKEHNYYYIYYWRKRKSHFITFSSGYGLRNYFSENKHNESKHSRCNRYINISPKF